MALITVNLPPLIPTSSGATVTNAIGQLNDARSITIFITSSANAGSSAGIIQISQMDPTIQGASTVRVSGSTAFYTASSSALALPSSGAAVVMSNISFQGLRISGLTSAIAGEPVAYVSKQIHV